MKIKVIIVDKDKNYTARALRGFQAHFADRIELRVFSDVESFYQDISASYADLILADSSAGVDIGRIPESTSFGYLCERMDVEEIDGVNAICKYQKLEILYKMMLGIFAEKSSNIKFRHSVSSARMTMFTSVQGGSGTSAAAAAYALRRGKEGKKIFYLSLEKFGDSDMYFSGDGIMSFSDVIYALKSKKSNLIIKLESAVKRDSSGVEFFSTCRNAYDMFELKDSEISALLQGIAQMKEYDEIVMDLSGDLNERMSVLMEEFADNIVYVCDGSLTGNKKFERFCEAVRVREQQKGINLLGKMILLYNRYSSKTSVQMEKIPINLLGGIHRFEGASGRELIEQISAINILNRI
ncbi:MAG: hypothetical protein KH828_04645 [Clostridiales bacterium]|nr:hypothetical protein [Clostridiales bacterium]